MPAVPGMRDSLNKRAQLAIEDSRRLRVERLLLERHYIDRRRALRLTVLESAMARAEAKARHDDKE